MLSPSAWPQTKSRFLLPNLNLQDEVLVLGREFRFALVHEGGMQRCAIDLRLTWSMEADQVIQAGTLDELPIAGFGTILAYIDLDQTKDTFAKATMAVISEFTHRVNEQLGA